MADALSPDMELALKRFQFAADSDKEYRTKALADMQMYLGDAQWEASIRNNRENESRPCLVINKLPGFVRQVTNGILQNMPAIRVIPVNDSDEDVAHVLDGIIRHIQDASHANMAYGNANRSQVIAGRGYFRVATDYTDEKSFDQDIKIKWIKDALTVYIDPTSTEPDESDAMYKFITSDITKDEFESRYPGKQFASNDMLTGYGDETKSWVTNDDNVTRIAEYFTIEEKENGKLYQLESGEIVTELPEGTKAAKERPNKQRSVKWRIISALEVLEEQECPGKYIPIIPVYGEDIDVNGKRSIKGMVRDASDPQRMYNYWASAQTEMIALAPKAPWVIANGQLEGFKDIWATANTKPWSYLPYNEKSVNGNSLPPPQRNVAEPPVQALVQAMAQATEDMKAVTGIYDASLGRQSNEVSGKAINARKVQGDIANYHFNENFNYSMLFCGKVLVDLIPRIYDAPRVVRILGEDGSSKYKQVNQPTNELDENGIPKIYDLTIGQYDVVIDSGPSYKTKRQEDAEMMSQVLQGNPELWQVAGDIFVKSFDWPDAQLLSDRLKKTLPPQLQDEPDGQQPIPPQIKQQLDQSGQMIQQLTQTVHALQDEKERKTLELESKERIALEGYQTQITLEVMKNEMQANHTMLSEEIKHINSAIMQRLELLNVQQPIDSEGNNATPSGANAPSVDNVINSQ